MTHHRKCEACESQTTTCQPTHPYLKRSSRSYTSINNHRKSLTPAEAVASQNDAPSEKPSTASTTNPDHITKAEVGTDPISSSEEMDFDQRIDAASSRASKLLVEAREQLTAPCLAPKELTAEEKAEKAAALEWAREYETQEAKNMELARSNTALFRDVIEIADSLVARETATKSEVGSPEGEGQSPAQLNRASLDTTEDRQKQSANRPQSTVGEANSRLVSQELPNTPMPEREVAYRPHRSTVPPQKQTNVVDSPGRATRKTAPAKTEWHTLWSCDFEARW